MALQHVPGEERCPSPSSARITTELKAGRRVTGRVVARAATDGAGAVGTGATAGRRDAVRSHAPAAGPAPRGLSPLPGGEGKHQESAFTDSIPQVHPYQH